MQIFYPESKFGGFTHVDGTIAFYSRVQALATPDTTVVDFGCGRGAYTDDPVPFRRDLRIFKGKVRRVIGMDVGLAGRDNPFLDEFHCLQQDRWPLQNASAGLVICDNVLEHLPDPDAFFNEAYRVLAPGGSLCIRTPNQLNYISLLSRIVPNRSHARVLSYAKPGLGQEDIFPTLYRCNTLPALRQGLTRHGFTALVYGYEAEPSYLSFSTIAYALGVIHQKLAPGLFKAALFAFARK